MKRSSPLRSRTPVKRKNVKRAAKKFVRNFHSPEYVECIREKPCAYCRRVGWSVAAHVVPRGMGGAKGKASDLVPLCDPNGRPVGWWPFGQPGCHWLYDNHKLPSKVTALLKLRAAELWAAYQENRE